MSHLSKWMLPGVFGLLSLQQISAQQKLQPYSPSQRDVVESYLKQARIDSLLKTIPLNARIQANWQQDNSFWYIKHLPADGQEYEYVNPATGTKKKAFDQERLADGIKNLTGKSVSAQK